MNRRLRFVEVSPELLADAIHLPAGSTIEAIRFDEFDRRLLLLVQHDSFSPLPEGEAVRRVSVNITAHHHESGPHRTFESVFADPQ